nr:hypothetical protein GCM10020093_006570 [Planobispora longispora]
MGGEQPVPSPIIIVEPDGSARVAKGSEHLMGANGIALSADGGMLVTAEAFANRLAAFDVEVSGDLSGHRVFADLGDMPDGMCLDAEGAAWVAMVITGRAIRVAEGGEILAEIAVPQAEAGISTACGLGGPGRRTLYLACGFEVFDHEKSRQEGRARSGSPRSTCPEEARP